MAEQMLPSTLSSLARWAVPAGPRWVKRLHRTGAAGARATATAAPGAMEGGAGTMEGDARNERPQTRGPKMLHSQSLPFPKTRPAAQRGRGSPPVWCSAAAQPGGCGGGSGSSPWGARAWGRVGRSSLLEGGPAHPQAGACDSAVDGAARAGMSLGQQTGDWAEGEHHAGVLQRLTLHPHYKAF